MSVLDINTVKMPMKAYNYIKSLIKLIEHDYNDVILAVGIFGSVSRGTADEFSDVDILIIYKDDISIKKRDLIYRKFLYLENIYNFRDFRNTFHNTFLYALMQTTGTFKSIFFTARQAWIDQDFIKIFQVSFIARLVVHQASILNAIVYDLKWVWINRTLKDDSIFYVKKKFKTTSLTREMVKSFVVTLSLSLGALVLTPLFKESTKFSIEAIKWYLFSLNHKKHLTLAQSSAVSLRTPNILIQLFKKNSRIYKYIVPYFNMRKQYFRNAKLNFLAPFIILYLFWKLS